MMDFVLSSTTKALQERGMKWGSRNVLELEYADDVSVLDEHISKMNSFLAVLRVQGGIIVLKMLRRLSHFERE